MYLHISHDDKFIDFFIRIQRKYFNDNLNKYLIYSKTDHLKFVKSDDIIVFPLNSKEFSNILKDKRIERIYIHFFSPKLSKLVLSLPKDIPVYWLFWGSDGFYLPKIYKKNLDTLTLEVIKKKYPQKILNFNPLYLHQTIINQYKIINHLKAIKRVNYFCHYLEDDFEMIKSITGFNATMLEFNYGSLYDISSENDKLSLAEIVHRDSIMLGNSADESNNHISALHEIKNKKIEFDKIYCPLSYSGLKNYVKDVLQTGNILFGHRFIGMTTFLSKSDYDQIMRKCKYFIHNHKRSQAFGNIAWQLFAGGNVIMNNESSLTKYLRDNGAIIKTIDSDGWDYTSLEKKNNSEIISKILSEEAVISRYKNIFK